MDGARSLASSASFALLVGIVLTLLVSAFGAAGVVSLTLARVMIAASIAACITYILFGSFAASLDRRRRMIAILLTIAAHLGIERTVTIMQPPPASAPMPPLKLLLPPKSLFHTHPLTKVENLPLAVTYLARPIGGYAGFGKVADNRGDDVMLAVPSFALANLSEQPLTVSWWLTVRGEGREVTLSGDGKGRWERQLGENDYLAATKTPLRWQLSPVSLPPHSALPITADLAFVAPTAGEDLRALIAGGDLPASYKAILHLRIRETGQIAHLLLPFGIEGVPIQPGMSERP